MERNGPLSCQGVRGINNNQTGIKNKSNVWEQQQIQTGIKHTSTYHYICLLEGILKIATFRPFRIKTKSNSDQNTSHTDKVFCCLTSIATKWSVDVWEILLSWWGLCGKRDTVPGAGWLESRQYCLSSMRIPQ